MNYWLFKSEGDCYSIDDLKKEKKCAWDGVRNYQARNFMRDEMETGDKILFYHSNGTLKNPNGIYGIAQVISKAHPDVTQFDSKNNHFDPKSLKDNPRWWCVDVGYVSTFKTPLYLTNIKRDLHLDGMKVREKGSRLSIQPVSKKHYEYIIKNYLI